MFWEEPFDHLSASYTRSTMICMYYWSLYTKWNNMKARLLADENKETSARFIEHGHKKLYYNFSVLLFQKLYMYTEIHLKKKSTNPNKNDIAKSFTLRTV